jgi:hypothetical protein
LLEWRKDTFLLLLFSLFSLVPQIMRSIWYGPSSNILLGIAILEMNVSNLGTRDEELFPPCEHIILRRPAPM